MRNKITHAKKRAMIEALRKTLGVITTACKQVEIERSTHYRWMREDQDYREAVEDVGEIAIDFVESQLFKQITEGNTASTLFYLKTKAKHRGYVERQEFTGKDGGPITHQEEFDYSKLSDDALEEIAAQAEPDKGKD